MVIIVLRGRISGIHRWDCTTHSVGDEYRHLEKGGSEEDIFLATLNVKPVDDLPNELLKNTKDNWSISFLVLSK